jgi:rubrerythrin
MIGPGMKHPTKRSTGGQTMDWLSFLKIMAMEEHAARAKYQLAVDLAEDEGLKAFFARLRDEEEFHAQYLEGEYEKLEKKLQESGPA